MVINETQKCCILEENNKKVLWYGGKKDNNNNNAKKTGLIHSFIHSAYASPGWGHGGSKLRKTDQTSLSLVTDCSSFLGIHTYSLANSET